MLHTANYERNANQNYSEVLPHTTQNDHHYKVYRKQILERVWKKGNLPTLLVRMKAGAAIMENSMEVPQKTKNTLWSYPCCCKWHYLTVFLWLSNVPLYTYT